MFGRHVLPLVLAVIPACEMVVTDDGNQKQAGANPALSNPGASGNGGCGGEAAAGGYIAAASDGPTNPDNPYANAVTPDAWLPCSAIGFNEHLIYCRFFQVCQLPCQAASDCPVVTGAPTPACVGGKFGNNCVLPCSDTSECPSGMTCVDTTIGYERACMWAAGPSTKH